jgi:hypothetical protein
MERLNISKVAVWIATPLLASASDEPMVSVESSQAVRAKQASARPAINFEFMNMEWINDTLE